MKVNNFMFLLIIIIFVNYSSQNYLKLTTHKTQNFRIQYDSWQDLIGKKVECPNRGVLKNFIIKAEINFGMNINVIHLPITVWMKGSL